MRNNIKRLLASNLVSNYKISKDIGIGQSSISDYATGKSDIGNMTLDHAEILNKYYEENVMMLDLKINEEEITKAKDEFNKWSGNAVVWIDFEDGKVWTDVEEIPSYHGESIYAIVGKDDMIDPNARYSVDRMVKLANLKRQFFEDGETDLLINSLDVNDIK